MPVYQPCLGSDACMPTLPRQRFHQLPTANDVFMNLCYIDELGQTIGGTGCLGQTIGGTGCLGQTIGGTGCLGHTDNRRDRVPGSDRQ